MKIGLCGAGVVGGGVYDILRKCIQLGRFSSIRVSLEISKICVRSHSKSRDFNPEPNCRIVTNYLEIIEDPEIDIVVELIGGTGDAKDIVLGALRAGKHVVTANKALIAHYLPEIQQVLQENPSASFQFEAAVCGGVPIIHSLQTDFLADSIHKVMGIMNGTTNFMLCKMEAEHAKFSEVLQLAQQLGYAEADPKADVDGLDVQAKLCLLTKLAFGVTVPFNEIPTTGISNITPVQICSMFPLISLCVRLILSMPLF
jgi:homoserine dehydrogenase